MEDILTLSLVGAFALFAIWDVVKPARAFPKIRFWRIKGLLFFVVSFAVASVVPLAVDGFLAPYRLIDATGLGTAGGAIVGLLALQFGAYWWHRALHRFGFLWRFHQMHHSAERVDIYGVMYFHPVDIALFTAVGSVMLVLVVGVSGEAALFANVASTLCSFLGHTNLRTPRWLGYIVQRPENHALHHERGVHAHNYGDIALFDIAFGTFRNPATWDGVGGFYDGASRRLGALLLTLDVTKEPEEEENDAPATTPSRRDVQLA